MNSIIQVHSVNYRPCSPTSSHSNESIAICYSQGLFITSINITLHAHRIWAFSQSIHQKIIKFTVISQCPLRGIGIIKADDPSEFHPLKLSGSRLHDTSSANIQGKDRAILTPNSEDDENILLGVEFNRSIISSRSIAVTIRDLSNCSNMIDFPEFNFNWNPTTKEFMQRKCGSYILSGVHVTQVGCNSCFKALCDNDIITHVRFEDVLTNNIQDDIIDLSFPNPSTNVIGYINRYGNVLVIDSNESELGQMLGPTPSPDSIPRDNHRLTLSEIERELAVGSKLQLQICRDKAWYLLESDFFCRSNRIPSTSDRYELFSGMIITPSDRMQYPGDMSHKLRITKVLEGSVIHILNSCSHSILSEGDVIECVNGKDVKTLTELHEAIPSEDGLISVRTNTGSEFVALISTLREDDISLRDRLNIPSNRAFLSSVVIE